jgi:hypothetical protein
MTMRVLAVLLLSIAVVAQEANDLQATMKVMSTAVTDVDHALAAGDRSAIAAPLQQLANVLPQLHGAPMRSPAAATAAIAAIEAAIADLHQPVGDGAESDAFDLGRLRRACTTCHLQNRTGNDERGLFPNRGGLVTGMLSLSELDGTVRTDRSDVVVFLEAPGLATSPLPRKPGISQQGRRFTPTVLAVTPGTTVRFPNDDVVFHNVFSLSRGNAFDLGIYGKGVEHERTLAQPGLVKVHCNIHPDMAADVLVLATPHTAITQADGFWAIVDVPPGDYTLRTWHPLADELRLPVRVDADTTTPVALTVRETRPRVQHPNKHGRPYDRRY